MSEFVPRIIIRSKGHKCYDLHGTLPCKDCKHKDSEMCYYCIHWLRMCKFEKVEK